MGTTHHSSTSDGLLLVGCGTHLHLNSVTGSSLDAATTSHSHTFDSPPTPPPLQLRLRHHRLVDLSELTTDFLTYEENTDDDDVPNKPGMPGHYWWNEPILKTVQRQLTPSHSIRRITPYSPSESSHFLFVNCAQTDRTLICDVGDLFFRQKGNESHHQHQHLGKKILVGSFGSPQSELCSDRSRLSYGSREKLEEATLHVKGEIEDTIALGLPKLASPSLVATSSSHVVVWRHKEEGEEGSVCCRTNFERVSILKSFGKTNAARIEGARQGCLFFNETHFPNRVFTGRMRVFDVSREKEVAGFWGKAAENGATVGLEIVGGDDIHPLLVRARDRSPYHLSLWDPRSYGLVESMGFPHHGDRSESLSSMMCPKRHRRGWMIVVGGKSGVFFLDIRKFQVPVLSIDLIDTGCTSQRVAGLMEINEDVFATTTVWSPRSLKKDPPELVFWTYEGEKLFSRRIEKGEGAMTFLPREDFERKLGPVPILSEDEEEREGEAERESFCWVAVVLECILGTRSLNERIAAALPGTLSDLFGISVNVSMVEETHGMWCVIQVRQSELVRIRMDEFFDCVEEVSSFAHTQRVRCVPVERLKYWLSPDALSVGEVIRPVGHPFHRHNVTANWRDGVLTSEPVCILQESISLRKDGKHYPDDSLFREFENEIGRRMELEHENVLRCYGCAFGIGTRRIPDVTVNVAVERFECDLVTWRSGLTPDAATNQVKLSALLQVARGLEALHSLHVVHRCLLPTTIFATSRDPDTTFKIGMFFLFKHMDRDEQMRVRDVFSRLLQFGKTNRDPRFLPPEPSGKKDDVYAFGILIWLVWTGYSIDQFRLPGQFPNECFVEIHSAENPQRPSFPERDFLDVPVSLKELAEVCWAPKECDRPFFSEIVQKLEELILEYSSPFQMTRELSSTTSTVPTVDAYVPRAPNVSVPPTPISESATEGGEAGEGDQAYSSSPLDLVSDATVAEEAGALCAENEQYNDAWGHFLEASKLFMRAATLEKDYDSCMKLHAKVDEMHALAGQMGDHVRSAAKSSSLAPSSPTSFLSSKSSSLDYVGRALKEAKKATTCDENRQYEEAYPSYMKAVDFFVLAVEHAEQEERKQMLQGKVDQLRSRAEKVRAYLQRVGRKRKEQLRAGEKESEVEEEEEKDEEEEESD